VRQITDKAYPKAQYYQSPEEGLSSHPGWHIGRKDQRNPSVPCILLQAAIPIIPLYQLGFRQAIYRGALILHDAFISSEKYRADIESRLGRTNRIIDLSEFPSYGGGSSFAKYE
jgi:hypothetical protein